MITKLTEKQKKGIDDWTEHCLKIGRDTSPINKEITETSWKKVYKILNKKEPKFWYCQSPLQAQIVINSLFSKKNVGKNIGTNIAENIRRKIRNNVRANIVEKIGANIWANIWEKIWENIAEKIAEKIGVNILANILANIKKDTFNYIYTTSWCQHDIAWIGYYKYFEEYGLLQKDRDFEIIDIWHDLSKACGWCYTFENIVFVCEKPNKISLNDRGELHNNKEMAIQYSDGYGLFMIEGVEVNRQIVEFPESITPLAPCYNWTKVCGKRKG